jgi:hypothetical protein
MAKKNQNIDDDYLVEGEMDDQEIERNLPELSCTGNTFDLFDQLEDIDKAIVSAIIRDPGIKSPALAKKIGRSVTIAKERRHKPDVEKCIEGLQKNDLALFLECRREAILTARHILRYGAERNRVIAAREFLRGLVPDKVQIEDLREYTVSKEDEERIEIELGIAARRSS